MKKTLSELREISYQQYENYLYQGAASFVLSQGHRLLEKNIGAEYQKEILEIGGARISHFQWIKSEVSRYVICDVETPKTKLEIPQVEYCKVKEGEIELPFPNQTFTRVIASHVLEHLPNPEQYLMEWMRVLRVGGILSLVQPCDPGLLWQLGKEINVKKWMKLTNLSRMEYDYISAFEHINSIYNLKSIIQYNFQEQMTAQKWPFNFLPLSCNLFWVVHIKKTLAANC